MRTLALCMILKNEAKTVRQVIERVLPLIDEVVIGVDKTTTDDTWQQVELALRGFDGNVVLKPFEFLKDFAQARNKFIERCSSDYVLVLDGHDFVMENSLPYLQKLKDENFNDLDVIDVVVSEFNPLTNNETLFTQPRIFRQDIRYVYAIHNTIAHDKNRVTVPQIIIDHQQPAERYEARKRQRAEINIDGLIDAARDGDTRAYYYIALVYYEKQDWTEAIKWFKDYLRRSKFIAERYQARLYLAQCYKSLGKKDLMLKEFFSAAAEGEQRNEHLFGIGDYYFDENDYALALYYYRLAAAVLEPSNFYMIERSYYTWQPYQRMATVYAKVGNIAALLLALKEGRVRAPELPIWDDIERRVMSRVTETQKHKAGVIYFCATSITFLEPVLRSLEENFMLRVEQQFNPNHVLDADVIWCEWADANAVAVSHYATNVKRVLRVHSYEIYSDWFDKINWHAWDLIIFIAEHSRAYWLKRMGGVDHELLSHTIVVPNGVDLQRFTYTRTADDLSSDNKIAWAGYMSNKKAPTVLLMLANTLNEFEFHVACKFQELDIEQLFTERAPDNLIIYPWQSDMVKFFADKDYVINTSPRESQSMYVLEAMACGCRPLVYNWIGASEVYRAEWTWSTFDELYKLIFNLRQTSRQVFRRFVEERYDLLKTNSVIKQYLTNLIIEKRRGE